MSGFNEKIRAIRMMKGIKQIEIAQLLNVRQQSVSKIENGQIQIGIDTAERIANYLGFATSSELETFYEKYIDKKSNDQE
ncbi:helix-turn-helix domain-containing protein [Dyadobacter sandarakinus]|uniref:Helix-turn-helix transcriptional regulator n=1 Tax=Dyadobacter sandarakinus TaxID=2747268 RepID=A0ABX7IDA2_9BACT|nr:helix-turn-helix transcriptional regulator [Dyadobacter sandarakinus]QRR03432.1 helix-turn-helix transcriptional regulator [Dyadobacter sandarakinus]